MDKFIVSFEEQGVCQVIDAADTVPLGFISKAVVQKVVAAHEFEIVDTRQVQI